MRGTFSILKVRDNTNHWNKEGSPMGSFGSMQRRQGQIPAFVLMLTGNHEGEIPELIGNNAILPNVRIIITGINKSY